MTSCTRCGDTPQPGCQSCENERLRTENAALEAKVRALVEALAEMQAAAPQQMDTTRGHRLYLANRQADAALALFRKEAADADA